MKKILGIGLIAIIFSLILCCAFAEEIQTTTETGEEIIEKLNPVIIDIGVGGTNTEATGIDCFDYYEFGSVSFEWLHADKHKYNPGDTVNFETTIKNNNPYPLVEGAVMAQIYWLNTESGDMQGDNLLKEFYVMEGLSLDKNQEYPLQFTYRIPKKAPNGYYYVALFYQVKKNFNMAGLPFINNVYGGSASFTVENSQETAPFYFDRNTVRLQGANQMLRNFSQSFKEGETVNYTAALKNPNSEKTSAYVEYRLFNWDQSREENLIEPLVKKEFIEIPANNSTDASITFSDLESGAYLLQIYSEANSWFSIINLRFSVEGEKGRFVFSGLDKFPLAEGDSFNLFSCFSNTTDWASEFNGRTEIELTDEKGNLLGKTGFEGIIPPKILAVKKELTAGKEIDHAFLTSKIYGSDDVLDQEITLEYDFRTFQTEEAYEKYFAPEPEPTIEPTIVPTTEPTQEPKPEAQPFDTTTILIALIVIIIVAIAFFVWRGKK